MQEPQYRSPGVRELLDAVAKSRVPCMSIMNMPPLPYVRRIPGLNARFLKPAYTDPTVWDSFDPRNLDSVQSRPAGHPPAGRKGQRAAGHSADQFQSRAFEGRKATAMLRAAGKGHRRGALRCAGRQDRIAGEAARAQFDFRAAGQMGDAVRRQLSHRDGGRHAHGAGSGAHRSRDFALSLQFRQRSVRQIGRRTRTISCRSRNMPRRRKASRVRLRRRARFRTARRTSNAPTSWCSSSPGRRAFTTRHRRRPWRWWMRASKPTARKRPRPEPVPAQRRAPESAGARYVG